MDNPIVSTSQTTTKNEGWVNVTTAITRADGSTSQVMVLQPRVKGGAK
jgi:hypothetical protein